jgi:hypothetical protein
LEWSCFDFAHRPYNEATANHFVKPEQGGAPWEKKSALTQHAVAASWQERSFARTVAGTRHHQGSSAPATTQAAKEDIHRQGRAYHDLPAKREESSARKVA